MRTKNPSWLWIAACALVACSEAPRQAPPPPARAAVLASFVAEIDAATGTLAIRPDAHASPAAALVELPTVQDGHPGTGPADTVELVTESAGAVADGCAPGLSAFEGTVRLRSFYATSQLRNVHVELTGITATGYESCDSAFPSPEVTVRRDFGLFPYGTITRAGTAGDSALATWRFRYPSATSFTVWGRVLGEVVPCVPPTVTSAAQDGGKVAVTFSEPMATGPTAAAISVTEAGRPVPGSVSASNRDQVFTFAPTVPFRAGVIYTITVASTAADPLGATLASPYRFTFSTEPQLSGSGTGFLQPLALAYDRAGNGLLVWGDTQAAPLQYAYYTAATGTWGDPVLLDAGGHSARVAASTTQFAVLWQSSAGIHVAIVTNGIAGARVVLASSLSGAYDLAIASNGREFLAAWAGTDGAFASVWEAVAGHPNDWSRPVSFTSFPASGITVAGDGAGYRAVWIAPSGSGFAAGSATYSGASGGWTGNWSIGELGPASAGISPALAVGPTTTCIAWSSPVGATLRVERGGTVTTTTGFLGSSWSALAAATSADRCQFAAAGYDGVYGASHDGTAWTTTGTSLGFGTFAKVPAVVPLGTSGFAVVAQSGGHVQLNRTTDWSFAGSATQVDTGAESARSAIVAKTGSAARVVFAKFDASGERLRIARVDASGVGAPETLAMPPPEGHSALVQIAANAAGDVVAVWEQQDFGTWNAFLAYRTAGVWGAPQLVAAGGREPVVASNGTEFLVAWRTALPDGTSQLSSRRLAAGAWLAGATLVTSGWIDRLVGAASDGAGYALSYLVDVEPSGVVFASGAWLTPQRLGVGSAGPTASAATVAGRSGEYLFAWRENGLAYYRRAAWNGIAWAWDAAVAMTRTRGWDPPALAAGPGGFAIAYPAGTSAIEGRLVTGGAAGPATALWASANGPVTVASSGTTYLAAAYTGTSVESRVWDGAQWRPARTMRTSPSLLALSAASDGTGYVVLGESWSSSGDRWAVLAPEPVSGGFSTVQVGPGSDDGERGALAGSTAGLVVAWKQLDPSVRVNRILARDL